MFAGTCCEVDSDDSDSDEEAEEEEEEGSPGSMQPGEGLLPVDVGGGRIVNVHYYLPPPPKFNPDTTPILFVLHGLLRDAENYFREAMDTGDVERLGIMLLCPCFCEEHFPKRGGYAFGNVFKDDVVRWQEKGKKGLPPLKPQEEWAFAGIEAIFDAVRAASGSRVPSYTMFGHSAGAQFGHRFALMYGAGAQPGKKRLEFGGTSHVRANCIVCANAGWYTMPHHTGGPFHPSEVFPFPYGLDLLPPMRGDPADLVRAYVQLPLLILLGEEDTDPSKPRPEIWQDNPAANAQGLHRLARGCAFFEAGQKAAAALGVPCNWTRQIVPGVGHAGGKMCKVAIRYLFDPECGGRIETSFLKGYADSNLA